MSDKLTMSFLDQMSAVTEQAAQAMGADAGDFSTSKTTEAGQAAERNFAVNIGALAATQPQAGWTDLDRPRMLEWVFGRDGQLTARTAEGRWWAGCSMPTRVASGQLDQLRHDAAVVAMACPPHAAHVSALLWHLHDAQAALVVVPRTSDAAVILSCEDFSEAISSGRLFLLVGESWPRAFLAVLADNPGLPPPAQVIRVTLSEDDAQLARVGEVTQELQRLAVQVTQERRRQIEAIKGAWHAGAPIDRRGICVVGPGGFRLWRDTGRVLGSLFGPDARETGARQVDVRRVRTDRATELSPLAMIHAAHRADAVVAADLFRADSPELLPDFVPWITWATTDRVPAFSTATAYDGLIAASPQVYQAALAVGWPAMRIRQAGWPTVDLPAAPAGPLLLLCDTAPTPVPEQIASFSSLVWLWEAIGQELRQTPSAMDVGIERYLAERLAKLDLPAERLPKDLFVQRLIVPAYAQGVALKLLRLGVPVTIRGAGWLELDACVPEDFAGKLAEAAGPRVQNAAEFNRLLAEASALVDCWPADWPHTARTCGRALLSTVKSSDSAVKTKADKLAAGGAGGIEPAFGAIHGGLVLDLLEQAVATLQE